MHAWLQSNIPVSPTVSSTLFTHTAGRCESPIGVGPTSAATSTTARWNHSTPNQPPLQEIAPSPRRGVPIPRPFDAGAAARSLGRVTTEE